MTTGTKLIWLPQIIVIVMLLYTPFFGDRYYPHTTLLKWVCCPAFAFLASEAWKRQKTGWVWVLGTVAVFFNPYFQPNLVWNMWYIAIPLAIGVAAASFFVLKSNNPQN